MKRIVVYTVLFALAFAYYFASTEKLEEIDTRLLKTVRMENGLAYDSRDEKILSGILVERDGDGAVLARVSYVSGVLHGTSEYFYRNARLKARVHYEKGVPEGLWEYFDMDGVKLKSIRYQKGVELQQQ
jgi:antitoxin component YwqK of YwqJK toxin-antitoxin module